MGVGDLLCCPAVDVAEEHKSLTQTGAADPGLLLLALGGKCCCLENQEGVDKAAGVRATCCLPRCVVPTRGASPVKFTALHMNSTFSNGDLRHLQASCTAAGSLFQIGAKFSNSILCMCRL